jgi:hypothetical protein
MIVHGSAIFMFRQLNVGKHPELLGVLGFSNRPVFYKLENTTFRKMDALIGTHVYERA